MHRKETQHLLLSTISHEIRNPLTLINSYLQLLSLRCPDIKEYSYWEMIQSEMKHLTFLLDDLSRYQNTSLSVSKIDIRSWLLGYEEQLLPLLRSYPNVSFQLCLAPYLTPIFADSNKLRQILDNLIRNALEALETSQDPCLTLLAFEKCHFLHIAILDNGSGISSEQAETLLNPFVTHKPNGTGLGLAIASRLTKAHGGSLTFSSVPGQRTKFLIKMPVQNHPQIPQDVHTDPRQIL